MEVEKLGEDIEDIIIKTREVEDDDEKIIMRQYEMMKQGTVFVEDVADEN